MASAQEQIQVNLGVANANLLVTRLGASYITWRATGSGTRVSAKIISDFAGLVNTNLNPLYSSSVPIYQGATTLTNFSVSRGVITSKTGGVNRININTLDLWNTQYVAWSVQLPTILQLGGIDSNKASAIINLFSVWYTNNIVPLVPKVKIDSGSK